MIVTFHAEGYLVEQIDFSGKMHREIGAFFC